MIERFLRSPFTMSLFFIGLVFIYTIGSEMEQQNDVFIFWSEIKKLHD
ncbi:hypothetical protein [Salibacterium salarium]|nr:hypothetical protein [Salibacterium salarium]